MTNNKNDNNYIYSFIMKPDEIKRLKLNHIVLCLVIMISTIMVGYVQTTSTISVFVTVPYALLIIPEGVLLLGCFNIVMMVDVMVYSTYKKAVLWVSGTLKVVLVCSGICVGGDLVFIAGSWDSIDKVNELIFLFGMLITLASTVIFIVLRKQYLKRLVKIGKKNKENNDE